MEAPPQRMTVDSVVLLLLNYMSLHVREGRLLWVCHKSLEDDIESREGGERVMTIIT